MTFVLRDPLYVYVRGPEYQVGLRSWFGAIPPAPPAAVVFRPPLYIGVRGAEYPVDLRSMIGALPPSSTTPVSPSKTGEWLVRARRRGKR